LKFFLGAEVMINRPLFGGDGWLRFPRMTFAAELQVAVRFLPSFSLASNCTIFQAISLTSLDFVRLEMVNETAIRLNASCGNGHPLTLTVRKLTPTAPTDFTTVSFRSDFQTKIPPPVKFPFFSPENTD
jgi:hypothetical protein